MKIRNAAKRSYSAGGVVRYWTGSLQRLYWRNREADEHFEGAVENLKDMITGQATVLALGAITGGYDDTAITCAALGTDDIGFPHQPNMRPKTVRFPVRNSATIKLTHYPNSTLAQVKTGVQRVNEGSPARWRLAS